MLPAANDRAKRNFVCGVADGRIGIESRLTKPSLCGAGSCFGLLQSRIVFERHSLEVVQAKDYCRHFQLTLLSLRSGMIRGILARRCLPNQRNR
jgi:hypothetical protein